MHIQKKVLWWAWNVVIRYPKQRKSLDDLKCQHTQHFFGNTFCFTKDYSSTGSQRRVLTEDPMACCLFGVKINSGIGCYLTLLVFWDSPTCCLALLFMNIIQICSFFFFFASSPRYSRPDIPQVTSFHIQNDDTFPSDPKALPVKNIVKHC